MLLTEAVPQKFWQEPHWNYGLFGPPDKPFEHWKTSDFIQALRGFPPHDVVTIESQDQMFLRECHQNLHQALADWLEYYLLTDISTEHRERLRQKVQLTWRVSIKTEADFSRSIRDFCSQLYGRDSFLSDAPSFEHLWFLAQYSICLTRMHLQGLSTGGLPTFFENGERITLLTKGESRNRNSNFISMLKKALNDCYLDEKEFFLDEQWYEDFLSILTIEGVKVAIQEDGNGDMTKHCHTFLKACQELMNEMNSSKYKQICLIGENLHEPKPKEKALTIAQVMEIIQPTPRRSRGRPPKGQNRRWL